MIKEKLHEHYCASNKKLADWYESKKGDLALPIYSSYDIRDAGFKISNVDANIYPAGFNNICPTDKETSVELIKEYVQSHYGKINRIALLTEEHTNNAYYWENVLTIEKLLKEAGFQVLIAIPRELNSPITVTSATGKNITVHSGYGNSEVLKSFRPELIISNNDFSNAHSEWAQSVIDYPINPPRELGWYQRKKSRYFENYNALVTEFSELCGLDPFLLNVKTEEFQNFNLAEDKSIDLLSIQVDKMIDYLRTEYQSRKINQEPVVFVKNNAGTYGLAVVRVTSGSEVKEWNYKSRKKMKAAKGGNDVSSVVIQEGIPTRIQADGATAEPAIYMIGCQLAGGFLRTHGEKSNTESLNSPGAVYKRLCVSDLNISWQAAPVENVYGWSARLGLLAIAQEAKQMGVEFKSYQNGPCRI